MNVQDRKSPLRGYNYCTRAFDALLLSKQILHNIVHKTICDLLSSFLKNVKSLKRYYFVEIIFEGCMQMA